MQSQGRDSSFNFCPCLLPWRVLHGYMPSHLASLLPVHRPERACCFSDYSMCQFSLTHFCLCLLYPLCFWLILVMAHHASQRHNTLHNKNHKTAWNSTINTCCSCIFLILFLGAVAKPRNLILLVMAKVPESKTFGGLDLPVTYSSFHCPKRIM